MTPELEYLHVKWSAHLPFAAAAALLDEVLPIRDAISVTGVKRRVRAVGAELDRSIETAGRADSAITPPTATAPVQRNAVAADSGWLKHYDPPRWQARHVNMVAGRAVLSNGKSRVCAYVTKQVPSAAARLDEFLAAQGIGPDERVTVLCYVAGEFQKPVDGSVRPLCRILDCFHIAMKFRAIEQTCRKHPDLLAPNGRTGLRGVASAKWLVWHGKARQAVARLKEIHDAFGLIPEDPYTTLWWNLRNAFGYLDSKERYLVNYGRRY